MNQVSAFLRKLFYSLPGSAPEKYNTTKKDFELLVSSIKDYAIIMLDVKGIVIGWNSGAEYIKGYMAKEITGKSFEVFYNREDIYKGEPKHNLNMATVYGRFEKNGWRMRKDSSCFWANIIFTALKDHAGRLTGFLKIVRDITETKRAQEQQEMFSRQINQSNDSIYTVDAEYKITSWNRGSEKLYGYTKEETLGKIPYELLATAITQEDLSATLTVIKNEGHWTGELIRRNKAGETIYVRSSTSNSERPAEQVACSHRNCIETARGLKRNTRIPICS